MNIEIFQVDAFTAHVFGGNPAAVCPLVSWPDPGLMQKIAMENNLSETAFFIPVGDMFEIRWFTPKAEIDLAGHPTLAAAHIIFNHLNDPRPEITFLSQSGPLTVRRENGMLVLNFPSRKPVRIAAPEGLADALGKTPLETWKARDILALFESEEDILAIRPNFDKLERLDCHAVIITATGREADFVSRFFAPSVGVQEDPVTGSAHTTLIPFWSEILGKKELHAFQLSQRRGELFCRDLEARVEIAGRAVTFMNGRIVLP